MIFEKHGDTAKDPFNFHADPHWQKKDPDPGHEHFFKIYSNFLTKQIGQIIFLSFLAYFYA